MDNIYETESDQQHCLAPDYRKQHIVYQVHQEMKKQI